MGKIAHKMIVLGSKGGVGKTMLATNIGYEISLMGYKVGILDTDIVGGAVARMLGVSKLCPKIIGKQLIPVEVSPNLTVIAMGMMTQQDKGPVMPTNKAFEQYTRSIKWDNLDLLIIDSSPGLSLQTSAAIALTNTDSSLLVTTPQSLALTNAKKTIRYARDEGLDIVGIVENMSNYRCAACKSVSRVLNGGQTQDVASAMGIPFLGPIPLSEQIRRAGDIGSPISALPTDVTLVKMISNIAFYVKTFLFGNDSQ